MTLPQHTPEFAAWCKSALGIDLDNMHVTAIDIHIGLDDVPQCQITRFIMEEEHIITIPLEAKRNA